MTTTKTRRAVASACLIATATLVALLTSNVGQSAQAGQSATTSRAVVRGQVGAHSFPGVATCRYTDNRLSAIAVPSPRAGVLKFWADRDVPQWILWGAQLQRRNGSGPWRAVRQYRYSQAVLYQGTSQKTLKPVGVRQVLGAKNSQFRVVQRINWYFNVRQENSQDKPIVQGQASNVLGRYSFGTRRLTSCPGVNRVQLPRRSRLQSNELDAVRESFSAGTSGVRYGLRGRLPAGLRLGARSGVVSGTIRPTAANVTPRYTDVRNKVFDFRITATKNGRTSSRSYRWIVADTAYVMQNYTNRYGCGGDCAGNTEPVRNISRLGPKFAFGCTNDRPSSIPAGRTSVIYRQAYQRPDGSLAPSAGRTLRYGDVLKWWYYPCVD